jgi:hypothetical protein
MGTLPSQPHPHPLNPGADRGGADSDMDCIKGGKKMREIKFRQPISLRGKFLMWHYWGFIDGQWVTWAMGNDDNRKDSQQFTGLLDKNGKEVFEGDVLHREKFDDWVIQFDRATLNIHNVKNMKMSYWIEDWAINDREVIGNIYENPELVAP